MISQFSLNPIIALEWRARWRGTRAFRVLFLCAALLGVAAFFSYYIAAESATFFGSSNEIQGAAQAGAGLFLGLSIAQLYGWLLVAPLLTATSIAAEREQGILEGVQLSRVSPLGIVLGKLASALLFALLLGAATLPILGICFLMGGVSPAEFFGAWLLQFSTALCGACFGLFFSARSRRAGIALRSTLIALVGWYIATSVIYFSGLGAVMGGSLTTWQRIQAQLAQIVGFSNPTIVFASATTGRFFGGVTPAATARSSNPIENLLALFLAQSPLRVCLELQLFAALFFVWLAARALRHPLGEFEGSEARRKKERRAQKSGAALSPEAASTRAAAVVAGNAATSATANTRELRPAGAAAQVALMNDVASTRAASGAAKNAGDWWEVPYFSALRFDNPMLQREVRGKFRMRRVSTVVIIFEGLLALGVTYLYLRSMIWALTDANARSTIWWVLSWIGLILLLIATPIMGASAFTRERETGTFEGIMLSLLTNLEIARGKKWATLFACAVYGVLPLLPLLLLCLRPHAYSYGSGNWTQGITVWQALATFCVLGAAAYAGTSVGMAASWTARRTSEAVGRALGIMFLWLALLPASGIAIFSLFWRHYKMSDSSLEKAMEILGVFGNPLYALGFLTGNEKLIFDFGTPFVVALLSSGGSILVAALARFYLAKAMHQRALEPERKR